MSTEIINYRISVDECQLVHDINKTKPRGPQIIICDYGLGPCISKEAIDNGVYSEWKDAIEAFSPGNLFSARLEETCVIDNLFG